MKIEDHIEKLGVPFATSQRGASLIEFAFVFPIFLVIIAGVLQFAIIYVQKSMVMDGFDQVISNTMRSQRAFSELNSEDLKNSLENAIQIGPPSMFIPQGIFAHLTDSGLVASLCYEPSLIEVKVNFVLRYSLACPMCALMTLGLSANRLNLVAAARARPEIRPSESDLFGSPICN